MKTQTQKLLNLTTVRRWAGELSYRVTTNRSVFYGSLFLAASLIAGAVTSGHEVLWRSAASLGIATVLIGLVHAWLDARADRQSRRTSSKDGESECSAQSQTKHAPPSQPSAARARQPVASAAGAVRLKISTRH